MAKAPATVETKGDKEDDLLARARKDYERAKEAWQDNQNEAREDLRFARLGEQWDEKVKQDRANERRPMLTFNKMPSFIRQVVNDARQNKPSIKVHPQDSNADPKVAEIINGLIRNIETTSDADIAYDTAIEHAVGQGFGFWRYNTAYTDDDVFDQDIVCERISNPFTVLGDPRSTAADSSDWNLAFVTTTMSKDEFEREYPDAEMTDWQHDFRDCPDWIDGDDVVVAEYWTREKVKSQIVAMSDGSILKLDEAKERADELAALGVTPVGQPRDVESYKVTQRIMSGAEVLKEVAWAGKYIPIVPVYGDEIIDETGKRHFVSLIRPAKSAQQMLNYWRTTTTELIALAPKAPWVGEAGAFDFDPNWETANSSSHSYLEVAPGKQIPQRQPFSGVPAGALQEALNANDDMKAIIGIYDASLGARSNETSGKAIMARQREGDVSTFHFIDNLSRAIRHGGRILLDLIPKVYTTERMIRILGEDMKPQNVQVSPTGQPVQQQEQPDGSLTHIFDITAGKYDLTVKSGPSFTSRREEASMEMQEMMRNNPQAVPLLGDIWAEQQDWPMADKIAERLKVMLPPQLQGQPQVPPEVQQQMDQLSQQAQQQGQMLQQGPAHSAAGPAIAASAQAAKDKSRQPAEGAELPDQELRGRDSRCRRQRSNLSSSPERPQLRIRQLTPLPPSHEGSGTTRVVRRHTPEKDHHGHRNDQSGRRWRHVR
jgi:hypothetical protein